MSEVGGVGGVGFSDGETGRGNRRGFERRLQLPREVVGELIFLC